MYTYLFWNQRLPTPLSKILQRTYKNLFNIYIFKTESITLLNYYLCWSFTNVYKTITFQLPRGRTIILIVLREFVGYQQLASTLSISSWQYFPFKWLNKNKSHTIILNVLYLNKQVTYHIFYIYILYNIFYIFVLILVPFLFTSVPALAHFLDSRELL